MASEWFYAREGKKNGPFSSMQLRAMAQSGQLLRTDLIWKNGMAEWRPAGASSQLFEGTQQSQVVVPAPPPTPTPVSATNGLKQTAQTAARAAQLAAERTKLSTVTLPGAYLQLGQHCYTSQAFASEFPTEFASLARITQTLATVDDASATTPAATLSERVKAIAGKGLAFANKKKAELEQAVLFTRLGQAAFEKHRLHAGPVALVSDIQNALDRMTAIDQQLMACKATLRVRSVSKKTLLLGSAGTAAALLLAMVGYGLLSDGRDTNDPSPSPKRSSTPVTTRELIQPTPEIPNVAGIVDKATASVRASLDRSDTKEPAEKSKPSADADSDPSARVAKGKPQDAIQGSRGSDGSVAYASSLPPDKRAARDAKYAPPAVPILRTPTQKVTLPTEQLGSVAWSSDNSLLGINGKRGRTSFFVCDAKSGEQLFPLPRHLAAFEQGAKRVPKNDHCALVITSDISTHAKELDDSVWAALAATVPQAFCFAHDEFLITEHSLRSGLTVVAVSKAPKWQPLQPSMDEPWADPLSDALLTYVKAEGLDRPKTLPYWPAGVLAPQKMCIPVERWYVMPNSPTLVTQYKTTLYAWDLASGQGRVLCDDALSPSSQPFVASKDGDLLAMHMAVGGSTPAQELIVWDTRKWTPVLRIKEEGQPVKGLKINSEPKLNLKPRAFSPDGRLLMCNKVHVINLKTQKAVASLDTETDGGAGWCADNKHVLTMRRHVPKSYAGRYDGDVFVWNIMQSQLVARLRHDLPSRTGQAMERLGDAGEMQMAVSADGTKLAVLSRGAVSLWDIPAAVLPAIAADTAYPRGDGTEEHPFTISPGDLCDAFAVDSAAAAKQYLGKWVAMPRWRIESVEMPTGRGDLIYTFLSNADEPGVRAFIPEECQRHRNRFDDPLKPPVIGLVKGTVTDAAGRLIVNVVHCDIVQSTPGLAEQKAVPVVAAEPISLAQFRMLQKGMTMEEVKKLFGGTGKEEWKEIRTRAKDANGVPLSYDEFSQEITVVYPGKVKGSQAVLVFEGNKQLQYKITGMTQTGLE